MSPTIRSLKIMLLLPVLVTTIDVQAQLSSYKAYTLFVYNFTKYIQWPDGAIKDEFVIGVYGKSPMKEELEKMVTLKKAGDKVIRVVEVNDLTTAPELHILFIPEEKSNHIASIVSLTKGRPVLLIGERQGLTQKGAGISFFSDQNNLRFELNTASIASQNLKVSKALEGLAYKGT